MVKQVGPTPVKRGSRVKTLKAAPQRKQGRPELYRPEFDDIAYKLCLLNYNNTELAAVFSVDAGTITDWASRHPSFHSALTRGRDIADGEVIKAVHHAAIGYSHASEEIKVLSSGGQGGSYVERVAVTKQYPPDMNAAVFWLTNRQRGRFARTDAGAGNGASSEDQARAAQEAVAAALGIIPDTEI